MLGNIVNIAQCINMILNEMGQLFRLFLKIKLIAPVMRQREKEYTPYIEYPPLAYSAQ
jgi:hypothetical protein